MHLTSEAHATAKASVLRRRFLDAAAISGRQMQAHPQSCEPGCGPPGTMRGPLLGGAVDGTPSDEPALVFGSVVGRGGAGGWLAPV